MEENESAEEKLEALKEDLNNVVQAQQTALELLTNLLCGEDEGDQWEEEEDDESDQVYLHRLPILSWTLWLGWSLKESLFVSER